MENTNELLQPSLRRVDYLKAIKILNGRLRYGYVSRYALCILLGEIRYKDYFSAPWNSFGELSRYYPELTKPVSYIDLQKGDDSILAVKERITILKAATEAVDLILKSK